MELDKNLSTLTSLPEETIGYLNKYLKYIHSHEIATQAIEKGGNIFELQLFEGTLLLQVEDDNVKYKFIPSEDFNEIVVDTILNKKSLLISDMTDKLKYLLSKAYKDVL